MKNFIKTMLVSVLLLVANNAFAISLQDLQVKDLDKIAVSEYVDYNDGTLINVEYVGSNATAIMLVSTGMMTIESPAGTAIVSSISLNAAAYDTLGELVDYLNTVTDIEAILTGGKRDDASVLMANVAAASNPTNRDIAAAGGYSVLIGTGAIVPADTSPQMMRVGITPQTGRRVALKYCTSGSDGTDVLNIYGKLRKYEGVSDGVTRDDTTLVASMATAADTEETNGNIYGGYAFEFAKDAHVVILAGDADGTGGTAMSTDATTKLVCYWDEK